VFWLAVVRTEEGYVYSRELGSVYALAFGLDKAGYRLRGENPLYHKLTLP